MAALWHLRCGTCDTLERNVACSIYAIPPCPTCGGARGLCDDAAYHPFIPYFDIGLGVEVTSLAQRWSLMKGEIDPESGIRRGQMDYRDKMSPGDLSARRDRVEAERKERAR